nr:hypothetical protein BgiMline_021738 [Biomphalaria glabrata]
MQMENVGVCTGHLFIPVMTMSTLQTLGTCLLQSWPCPPYKHSPTNSSGCPDPLTFQSLAHPSSRIRKVRGNRSK